LCFVTARYQSDLEGKEAIKLAERFYFEAALINPDIGKCLLLSILSRRLLFVCHLPLGHAQLKAYTKHTKAFNVMMGQTKSLELPLLFLAVIFKRNRKHFPCFFYQGLA